MGVDVEDDDGEASLAAVGCVQAIRRLVEAITKDAEMIDKLRAVVFPILMHSLSIDGLDAIEDGLDIISVSLYYGKQVHPEMWKLFPQLLHIVAGRADEIEGGFAHEYLSQAITCV